LTGGRPEGAELTLNYAENFQVRMQAEPNEGASLIEKTLITLGSADARLPVQKLNDGVHIDINQDDINIDKWLDAIIELAQYESSQQSDDNRFLDLMRTITLDVQSPIFLDREFGEINLKLFSVDGAHWSGRIDGENAHGTMQLQPRDNRYTFNLDYLNLGDPIPATEAVETVDYDLQPSNYPSLSYSVKTIASGNWVNNKTVGSVSSFDFVTTVSEAEDALDDISLDGFIKKGKGSIKGNIHWIGAPHEFDFARLNGEFDLRIQDGELVKVEPGGGKLLGLLNFNAIARRLTLDFTDVVAAGLKFDRMQYTGLFSDGRAVMREAYIFSPAVFVRMEGQLNIVDETIDMEIHMSPELGGNIALLSALANPAAGAVVFLTQQLFKDQFRNSTFTSYRALGTWEDFELEQFKINDQKSEIAIPKVVQSPVEQTEQ